MKLAPPPRLPLRSLNTQQLHEKIHQKTPVLTQESLKIPGTVEPTPSQDDGPCPSTVFAHPHPTRLWLHKSALFRMLVISNNWLHTLPFNIYARMFYDRVPVAYKWPDTLLRIPALCTLQQQLCASHLSCRKEKIFKSCIQIIPVKHRADSFKLDGVKIYMSLSRNTKIFAMETPVSLHGLLQPQYTQFALAMEAADKPPLLEPHQGNTIRITTTM